MADIHTQSCDVCGTLRKETNHWFKGIVRSDRGGIFLVPWGVDTRTPDAHLCGIECTLKWAGRELQKSSTSAGSNIELVEADRPD